MRGVAKDKEQNQRGSNRHADIGPSDDAVFAAVLADILGTERRKEDGGNHADDGQNGGQTHIADQNTVEQRVDDGLAGHLLCQLVRSVGGNVALQGFVVLENLDNVGHFQRFGLFGADKGFRLIVGRNAQTDQSGADTRGKQRHITGSGQEGLVVGAAAFGQQHNIENHRHCHAKTEILQPGEAQTLKITFRYEDMASYDSNGIKSANGAYVLEAGNYKINLCSDSHTILDTYVAKVDKDVIYDDAHDGARSTDQVAATNQLTFAQGDVTYLSRADGFANYAEATAAPANHSLSAQALADYASAATFDAAKYDDPNAVMPTTGANNGLKLADLTGVAYDDPKWEQLLDELTVNDLFSLTADGGYHTVGVESIGLSATEDCDGPTGVHSNYNPAAGPSYPGTVMLACTWNQPLAKARGEQIAKECAEINCTGWYAPAMNIHRSAFGGRNFEYYSECGVLSGLTAAAEVSGATENGLICYVKHFAFNDQDNYRQNNICTWLNEQSAREIYLKAFEQPIKAGGMGVMTSMNAVGPVWAGGCKALLTNILRDEWGFHGAVITDAVVSAWYMDGNLAIRTGGTKMLAFNITNEFYRDLNSVGTVTAMRNAAHGTLYALANSFAVTRAVAVPKWVKTTYAVDAVVAIILVAWEICAIRKYRKAKKEDEDTEQ